MYVLLFYMFWFGCVGCVAVFLMFWFVLVCFSCFLVLFWLFFVVSLFVVNCSYVLCSCGLAQVLLSKWMVCWLVLWLLVMCVLMMHTLLMVFEWMCAGLSLTLT